MQLLNRSPIYLRALEMTDFDNEFAWHNDSALYDYLRGNFHWVSHLTEEEWLRQHSLYSANEINLAICISETHEHIGNIYLRDIDWVSRRAELHLFIGNSINRGHGYGEAAVRSILKYAFKNLGLKRIFLFVLASNAPAISLYKKCGFLEEGKLRNHAFKNGKAEDILVMGLLEEDWQLNALN